MLHHKQRTFDVVATDNRLKWIFFFNQVTHLSTHPLLPAAAARNKSFNQFTHLSSYPLLPAAAALAILNCRTFSSTSLK